MNEQNVRRARNDRCNRLESVTHRRRSGGVHSLHDLPRRCRRCPWVHARGRRQSSDRRRVHSSIRSFRNDVAQVDKKTRSELNAEAFAQQQAFFAELIAAAEAESPDVQRKRVERAKRFAAKMQRREANRMTLAKYQAQLERTGQRMHSAAMQQATRDNLSAARIPQRAACNVRHPRGHRSIRRACARSPGRKSDDPHIANRGRR